MLSDGDRFGLLRLTVHGFGVSDTGTGRSGERLVGEALVEAFDEETGTLRLRGTAACLGDSGGPVLKTEDGAVIDIVSEVSAGVEGVCYSGMTVASNLHEELLRKFPRALLEPKKAEI